MEDNTNDSLPIKNYKHKNLETKCKVLAQNRLSLEKFICVKSFDMGQSQLLSLIYQYNSVGPAKIILICKITIKQQGLDANTTFLDIN